jgi:hypothetical protein
VQAARRALGNWEIEMGDQDFKEAERIALDAPSYASPSHTWWRRRSAE